MSPGSTVETINFHRKAIMRVEWSPHHEVILLALLCFNYLFPSEFAKNMTPDWLEGTSQPFKCCITLCLPYIGLCTNSFNAWRSEFWLPNCRHCPIILPKIMGTDWLWCLWREFWPVEVKIMLCAFGIWDKRDQMVVMLRRLRELKEAFLSSCYFSMLAISLWWAIALVMC